MKGQYFTIASDGAWHTSSGDEVGTGWVVDTDCGAMAVVYTVRKELPKSEQEWLCRKCREAKDG
jgi:hypothetical protein